MPTAPTSSIPTEGTAPASVPMTRAQICALGGRAAHAQGKAHRFTPEEARAAGRKGGMRPKRKKSEGESKPNPSRYATEGRTPRARFRQQKRNAKKRGIAWEFTFDTWWSVWEASGKWEQRGVKKGCYVMARYGDVGPYAPGNVSIIRHEENVTQALVVRPVPIASYRDRRVYLSGGGKGWRYRSDRRLPYEVRCRGTIVGHFLTQEQAEAAYRDAAENFNNKEPA